MKYTISVSKTYKHRGRFRHKLSTKKHWFHYFYEYDEIDEELKLFCEQVSWLKAMYYKGRKYKRRHVTCPNCRTTSLVIFRKEKELLKEECSNCLQTYEDLFEEYLENS